MWVLLVITLVNGGESPSKFETVKFATLEECVRARTKVERNPAAHGYCTFESKKLT